MAMGDNDIQSESLSLDSNIETRRILVESIILILVGKWFQSC